MNIDCVISSCSFGYSKLFSINVKEITAMRIITAQKPNCSFSNDYKKNTIAKIIATPTQSQMLGNSARNILQTINTFLTR